MSRKSNRREFLKTGLITTAAVIASGPAAMISPRYSFAQGAPDLVISHGRNPATMTRAAVDALGGMKRFVKPGNKVVIKPNMSFASGPQAASNTNPAVVGEVARMCSEAGASTDFHSGQPFAAASRLSRHVQDPGDVRGCAQHQSLRDQAATVVQRS